MHKQAEPRAVTLRRLAIDLEGWQEHGRLLDGVEVELGRRKGVVIPINLAGALGALLADLGFDPLAIGGLGALSYGMALLAHIVEEVREGVPLRIIPDALGAHYAGPEDRASHAHNNRRTARTEVMFRTGGIAYVYLCYGLHSLFNIVTNRRCQ